MWWQTASSAIRHKNQVYFSFGVLLLLLFYLSFSLSLSRFRLFRGQCFYFTHSDCFKTNINCSCHMCAHTNFPIILYGYGCRFSVLLSRLTVHYFERNLLVHIFFVLMSTYKRKTKYAPVIVIINRTYDLYRVIIGGCSFSQYIGSFSFVILLVLLDNIQEIGWTKNKITWISFVVEICGATHAFDRQSRYKHGWMDANKFFRNSYIRH